MGRSETGNLHRRRRIASFVVVTLAVLLVGASVSSSAYSHAIYQGRDASFHYRGSGGLNIVKVCDRERDGNAAYTNWASGNKRSGVADRNGSNNGYCALNFTPRLNTWHNTCEENGWWRANWCNPQNLPPPG